MIRTVLLLFLSQLGVHYVEGCNSLFGLYSSLYESSFSHRLISISELGDAIELEDGSFWKICDYDRHTIFNWRPNDPIAITQNHRWFSSYEYRVFNKNTGTYFESNLFLAPLSDGKETLYIAKIDLPKREILISKGNGESTLWEICSSDALLLESWILGDPVIIGQNSGADSDFEIILINVNQNHWARAVERSWK